MTEPFIRAEHISRIYRKNGSAEVPALLDVSLDINSGEFVAIMGASGSGKSTLMNLLGCLDRPTSGLIMLDGTRVSNLDDEALATVRNRRIGFVFQSFNLLPRATAIENVELPLLYSSRRNIEGLARKALEDVGFPTDRLKHYPSELSGGQQQRVAVARAIVNDPEIIFADEPTGNLDSEAGAGVMALFHALNAGGRTVVLVTHEAEIAAHARRIIRIADGRVVSDQASIDSTIDTVHPAGSTR
jgi:putative ABC transport system ATP-binding protein